MRTLHRILVTSALAVFTVASSGVTVAFAQDHADPGASEHAAEATHEQAAPAAHGMVRGTAPHGAATGAGAHGEHGSEAHGEHAEGGEHAEHELGPINWTDTSNKKQPPYIAMLINFAALLFIYYRFGKKPVADGLKKRREDVAKQIEEADRIKKEAAERAKKYQAQLASLDAEAEHTKAAIRTSGEADRDRVIKEAQEKAARLERDAQLLLEAESKQAKRELYEEAVEAAVVRAEELLRSKLTQADHERLAEEFLSQLASQKGVSAHGVTGSGGGGALASAPMDKRGDA